MYLDFYGFKEKPFTLSPNPKFLFYSGEHKEAFSRLMFAVLLQQQGYMVLTGEVGTGKTTLINELVNRLPADHHVAQIYHSALSPKGLVQNICNEFGISYAKQTMAELVFELQKCLKRNFDAGKKSVLILDEAQNLSPDILEEIRLLSNFEDVQQKYLQIVLVGQPELETTLKSPNLRQLKDRIALQFRLKRLNSKEIDDYVNYRLKVAGCQMVGSLFTQTAINRICMFSSGIPRRINIVCDRALLMGYTNNCQQIDEKIIEKVKSELADENGTVDDAFQADAKKNARGKWAAVSNASLKHQSKATFDQNGKFYYFLFSELFKRFLEENGLLLIQRVSLLRKVFFFVIVFIALVELFVFVILLTNRLEIFN